MKRCILGLCGLLALCAADHTTVYAEEYFDQEEYEEYYEEFYDDSSEDYYESDSDDFGSFGSDQTDNALSEKHLDILDRLGALLDYESSVSENDLGDSGESIDTPDSPDLDTVYFGDGGVVDILSSIDSSLATLSDVSLYSDFTAFNGAISTTYLDLFKGFLPKIAYNQHYVLYRESQYVYSFVFGDDLTLNGTNFTGNNLTRVYFNAYNSGTFGHSVESSFRLNAGSTVVYTDLGSYYPALSTDTGAQLIQIKWVIFVSVIALWMISLFKGARRRGDKDKKWASINTV